MKDNPFIKLDFGDLSAFNTYSLYVGKSQIKVSDDIRKSFFAHNLLMALFTVYPLVVCELTEK